MYFAFHVCKIVERFSILNFNVECSYYHNKVHLFPSRHCEIVILNLAACDNLFCFSFSYIRPKWFSNLKSRLASGMIDEICIICRSLYLSTCRSSTCIKKIVGIQSSGHRLLLNRWLSTPHITKM